MELGVKRIFKKQNYTIGRFYIDSLSICNTLEPPIRELIDWNNDGDFNDSGEGKIYGKTAILPGRYKVSIRWWNKHQKWIPVLRNVKGFDYIYIHGVATVKDTLGCIGVGENTKIGILENGPYWSNYITQKVQEAIENKEEVWITII